MSASAPPSFPSSAPAEPLPQSQSAAAPEIVLEAVSRTLRDYGYRFEGNPIGTNVEITRALNGGNPKGVKFLTPELQHFNEKGELLDPWGTPYFFHQLSAHNTEVRSAGADQRMWTEDDLLMR